MRIFVVMESWATDQGDIAARPLGAFRAEEAVTNFLNSLGSWFHLYEGEGGMGKVVGRGELANGNTLTVYQTDMSFMLV